MKYIFALILIPTILLSGSYDKALLQIGAKLFPKIAFIEKGTKERIRSTLNFVIVTTPSNQASAYELREMIQRQYPNGINNFPLNLSIASARESLDMTNIHGFILLLDPNEPLLEPLMEHAYQYKILSFSLEPSLLQKGVAVSLFIGRSVKPYINTTTLKQTPFTFDYGFLKLSQPYN